jgi:hypothetical protein
MGYTSERTTINKSLESLNQETQRLQKQTNYEFDRLNQRRRDNIAGNAEWLQNNQLKLDVGMQQYRELQDAYEPESGWNDSTRELMGTMRDEYYNLLQNKVPKLDKNGKPIEGEFVEDIKRSDEEKANLMKGVKTVSQMQGANKGITEKINEASKNAKGKPGAVDPTTNPKTLKSSDPETEHRPKYIDGKIVDYEYHPIGHDADGKPIYDYNKPNEIWDGGNYVRAVEAGEIGISTYGDGGPARNQLQTERYDIYADQFSKFKDSKDLNNVQTYKDFTETFQNFENDLAKMDVSHIINNNTGMAKNWTNIVDRMAENASSDFYGDGENPFATMLQGVGVTDTDGDGKISGPELNAIAGAWREGDEAQKKLAETFYRTYDPSSGILPSYLNDMVKTSQTIGQDQLTKKEREDLAIKQQNANTAAQNADTSAKNAQTKEEKLEIKRTDAFKANPNAVDGLDNAALVAKKPADPTKEGEPFKLIKGNGDVITVKWNPTGGPNGDGGFSPV